MFGEVIGDGTAWLLILASAGTSLFTAAFGIGGGILLLALMGLFLPATALIPIHGIVQIGSNAGRVAIMVRNVQVWVLAPFVAGSILGAALGGSIAVQLPPAWMKIGLGCFILFSVWRPTATTLRNHSLVVGGAFSSFLTMFFGTTGPFVSTLIKSLKLERLAHIATHSACMTAQHTVKVMAFGILGFAYVPWLPFIAVMILSGFIGTLIGRRLLMAMTDTHFHTILKWILTALALMLVREGWSLL